MNPTLVADLLASLNPVQRHAVETTEGPVLVLAGPGSGKTRVITHRIAYLARERKVAPWSILAVTFTNRAAREMVHRLQSLLPGTNDQTTVGTFHAFCTRVLRRDGHYLGIDRRFVIYDDEEQISVIRKALESLNLDEKRYPPRSILSQISSAKSEMRGPREYAEFVGQHWEEVVLRVYRAYQEMLEANQALDFDDLLLSTVRLFRERADVLQRYQDRYQYLMVDEFQDTNIVQYTMVKQLGGGHGNVCVVGDEDQSIYSWRSADIRNILNFERDFPGCQVILLEQNYRSTKKILAAAQAVISANQLRKPKRIWTENPDGLPIIVNELRDDDHEAYYVVSEISRLLASDKFETGHFAVMFRTNAQSRALEQRFIRERIPHKVIGVRFYQRKEIKDILAYLRLILNPADGVSFLRVVNVPPRGIGAKTVAEIERWAERQGLPLMTAAERLARGEADDSPLAGRAERAIGNLVALMEELRRVAADHSLIDLMRFLLSQSGYGDYLKNDPQTAEERMENITELLNEASRYQDLAPGEGLQRFLEETALFSDTDEYDRSEDAVTLITLHAAKGLEFPVVFLTGVEEGYCPHSRSIDDPHQMEEERRLFYVGITRAMERLYLTCAMNRNIYSGLVRRAPSRFLADVPSDVMRTPGLGMSPAVAPSSATRAGGAERPAVAPAGLAASAPTRPRAANGQFKSGERVRHAKFGEGIVVKSSTNHGDEEVEVAFQGIGVKRLSLAFANLERI